MTQAVRDTLPPDFRLRVRARVTVTQRLQALGFRDFLRHVRIADPHQGIISWQDWPLLVELAEEWESGQSQIVLKARQIGVSWLLAAYMVWRVMYQPGAVCLALSRREDEATKLVGHREAGKARIIYRNLPENIKLPLAVDNALELAWEGGGRITAFSSTEDSGRSESATLIAVDEAAFHPYAAANYAAYHPAIDAGGQLLMVSTAHHVSGQFFRDLYWASKAGQTPYQARFRSWRSRPGRDDAWLEAERSAFVGLPAEFDEEYPESDAAAFVALTGLVHASFNEMLHVKPAPCAWKDCKRRYAGVDFGGGDPTAVVMVGVTARGHVHQYGEFYRIGSVTVEDIGEYIWRWHHDAPLISVECDPSEPVAINSLRALQLPARAADNRRGEGLAAVDWLLSHNRLTLDDVNCPHSIREHSGYRWRERIDPNSKDRYKTGTPVDHHADAMDARRYVVVRIIKDETLRQGVVTSTVDYGIRPLRSR